MSTPASRFGLSALRLARSKRVPTVLAPALPALVLLAITTAGMVDPPQAGLATQFHVNAVISNSAPGTVPVTAR